MPLLSKSRQRRPILALALALSSSSGFAQSDSPISVWAAACNQIPEVTERVGAMSDRMVREGMGRLHAGGLLNAIRAMSDAEVCLSVSAAAVSRTPALVMFAQLPEAIRNSGHASVPELRRHHEREYMATRLANMDINMAPGISGGDGTTREHRIYGNRAILAGAKQHWRSYAATNSARCIISLRDTPLAAELQRRQLYVWNLLAEPDQRAVSDRGEAYEFWHEVGHCSPDTTAGVLSAGTAEADQLEQWADRRHQESQQCSGESAQRLWAQHQQRTTRGHAAFADVQGQQERQILNQSIHFALIKESLADRFAEKMVRLRLNGAPESCRDDRQALSPWYRLRLAWSVRDPDARYMTWVTPWLAGLSEQSQHQVLVEAHAGLMRAAKERLPEALHQELMVSRQGRPDRHRLTDPGGRPDPERVEAWARWIKEAFGTELLVGG